MARRRKHIDLRGIDPESPQYWEEELHRAGLSIERGRSKRISYVGGTDILEALHGAQEAGTRSTEGDIDMRYQKNDDPDSENG